jgi:hypothetical protein
MKLHSRSLVTVALLAQLGLLACSSDSKPGNTAGLEDTGSIGLALQIAPGENVSSAAYTITGPKGYSSAGTIALANSTTLSANIGGIPAGVGYSITITATTTDGTTSCAGSASFDITAHATTTANVRLLCHEAARTGSVQVNGALNTCPVIDAIGSNPSEVLVGSSIALSATAHDSDSGPAPLGYQWVASSGTLSSPTAQNPTFTCTSAGTVTLTVTVSDGDPSAACSDVLSETVICTSAVGAGGGGAGGAASGGSSGSASGGSSGASAGAGGSGGSAPLAALTVSLDSGVSASTASINQGTAIGEGALNGATPFTLTNLADDPNNTQTITSSVNPFGSVGTVPDTAFGFCDYSGATPKRVSYVTGAKFETTAPGTAGADPMVPMAPFYFPLVYNTANTVIGNGFGGKSPIVGLFDWRPKDTDEALVAAESDDNGKTWFFMQSVLELFPDYTNPISGGFSATSAVTGCPPTVTSTNAGSTSANGSSGDDGWGHASIIQLPGVGNIKTGQFLYMLDRSAANIDLAPLNVINLTASSNKFPIWNTNNTSPGNNDIKSISSALSNSPGTSGTANAVVVKQTSGLLNPDGILAVFPTSPTAAAGSPVTVLYVQKILNGDNTGATALPVAEQCAKAPFSGKTNHDISNVRLATTTDGLSFTDLGIVSGLNDPTTVDYNKTRWVSPRGTLLDINGDGSRWGLLFSAGNCLDGDSDAFHYIGYAESSDMMHWTVFNDINTPVASINTITTKNQANGVVVTIPANPALVPTQAWFGQRLYAPTATQIDATHLSLTFAGYAAQTPANNLLAYRQIGNVVLTVSKALPPSVPNNVNTH